MDGNAAGLRIHLAGPLRVEAGTVAVEERRFPGRLGRLAFAYLAAHHDHPVPRDQLAEVLWEGEPPATWEKGTVVLVSKLRAALSELNGTGGDMLTNAYGCYQLSLPPGAWVDITAAAESLQTAERALDRGDVAEAAQCSTAAAAITRQAFLPGEDGSWVTAKRAELRAMLVRALACSAESLLRLGEPRRAIAAAAEAVRAEPFRESGYVVLMRAHAAAGDRGEALRVHEDCRRLLAEELGVDPSPATEAVYLEILKAASTPAPQGRIGEPPPAPAARPPAPAAPQDDAIALSPPPAVSPRRRRILLASAAAAVVVVAGTLSAVVIRRAGATSGAARVLMPAVHTAALIAPDGTGFSLVTQVGDRPDGVVVSGSSTWVIDYGAQTLTRIDAGSGEVLRTEAVGGAPTGITAGDGAIWVTTAFGLSDGTQGSVQRFDAGSGAPAPPLPLGDGVTGVAVGDGAVWVTDDVNGSLLRLDPLSGTVAATIPVGRGPQAVVVSGTTAWVANGLDGTVSRVDLSDDRVTATLAVPDPVALAADGSSLWVASSGPGTLTRIDTASGRTLATVPVGSDPIGVAVTPRGIWVAVAGTGEVVRVDAATDQITAILHVRGRPGAIGAQGNAVWITVEGS